MTPELANIKKQKIKKIFYYNLGASLVGGVFGILYANKKGGNYIGFFAIGAILFGGVSFAVTLPEMSKIDKEGRNIDEEQK